MFLFVLGPGPVCLMLRCCFPWRNASLAGGFAGRLLFSLLVLFFLCLWCVDLPLYRYAETTAFQLEFLISLTCLYQFQDRALERHRPNQRKKKVPILCAILQLEFELKWNAWFSRVPTESNIADEPSRGQIKALLDKAVHQQHVDQRTLWDQTLEFATRGGVDQHRDALVGKEVSLRGQLNEN